MKNRKGQLGYIDVRMTQDKRKMARIRYWDDVPGQHARKRRSTEWRDVTDWSYQQIQLWQMQVIAEAGVQDHKKPIPSEVNFESHASAWLEQNLPRYKKSFRKSLVMFVHRYLIPEFGPMPIEEITADCEQVGWFGTPPKRRYSIAADVEALGKDASNHHWKAICGARNSLSRRCSPEAPNLLPNR